MSAVYLSKSTNDGETRYRVITPHGPATADKRTAKEAIESAERVLRPRSKYEIDRKMYWDGDAGRFLPFVNLYTKVLKANPPREVLASKKELIRIGSYIGQRIANHYRIHKGIEGVENDPMFPVSIGKVMNMMAYGPEHPDFNKFYDYIPRVYDRAEWEKGGDMAKHIWFGQTDRGRKEILRKTVELVKRGIAELNRSLKGNPPMYAHHLYERKTHGLNLQQMRRLYVMVSRGNKKAIAYARNFLGIPFDETPSQVKAVVKHHVIDLAQKNVRRNPSRTRYMLVERSTGKPISDVTTWGVSPEQGGYTSREILALRKLGVGTKRFKTVRMRDIRRNPSEDVAPVVFRTFRGDHSVIALFPFEPGNNNPWTMMSYQHIGQHGIADHTMIHAYTRASTPDEIRPLKKELEQIGYKLKIITRVPNNAWKIRDAKIRRIK